MPALHRIGNPVGAIALLLVALGSAVLVGWWADVPTLRSILPGTVSMKANTALGLLLAGAALACRHWQKRGPVPWLAAGVLAIGLLQVIQAVTGHDLGIDQLLVSEILTRAQEVHGHPGRMSPLSAAALCAAGTALLLGHRPSRRRAIVTHVLAAAVAMAGFNAVAGYVSQVPALYRFGDGSMALHSALAFVLLGAGILLSDLQHGIGRLVADRGAGGRQLRRLLPAVTLVPLLMHAVAMMGFLNGWYDSSIANVMLTTGNACVLGAVAIWSSLRAAEMDATRNGLLLALAEREGQFRSTFENAFVGMGLVDPQGRWRFVNQRLCDILRSTPADMVGRPVADLLPIDLAAEKPTEDHNRRALHLEVGGETLSLDIGCKRLGQPGTSPGQHLVMVHDITELRRTAEHLRVRDRALASTMTGVVIADAQQPDHPIVYVNEAFTRITGYPAEEAMGRNCRFLHEGLPPQAALDDVRRAIRSGSSCVVQLRNRRRDGREFWNRLSLTPVHDSQGRITHWLGVQEDISAEIAAGLERERLLRQALDDRASAERASRARDALLAVVSHELRSPLNAMRLWASLLSHRPDAATAAQAARQIESNIAAQSRLISDLVDVSRMESGRLELERAPVSLGALVAHVFESQRPLGEAKGLVMRLAIPEGRFMVNADADRIQQVLRNLLDNAIKFTTRGSIEVTVAADEDDVTVAIADSGRGMTAEQQENAFQVFWQGSKEDSRSHGGLGLGLYLVREILQRHDGSVSAHSQGPGKGSTFRFRLPLVQETQPEPAPTRPAGTGSNDGRAVDILVVDDEPSTAEGLALALRHRGYPVRMATNADRAMALIRNRRPRVLLSDIMMPEKTGVDLITEVRAAEQEPSASSPPLHAIAMSGRGGPSDRRRLLQAGFNDYLQKPIDVDGLVIRIQQALAGADGGPPPA